MSTPSTHTELVDDTDQDDPSGRLTAYMARTRTPLDLLALATLWIVLVPPSDFGSDHHASTIALIVRVALSVVYAIDLAIRAALAQRHWHYVRTHPLSLVVVVFPPLRVVFSLRLVTSLFRRGNLSRFLLAAFVLVLNGAIVVDLFERDAPGGNIHSLGQSVWWSVTTVTTVGYGDYFPVTVGGQVAAACIMAIGILTLAVVTAQVSSSFVDQAARRRASAASREPSPDDRSHGDVSPDAVSPDDVSLADLAERLTRIEALLMSRPAGSD